MKIKNYAKMYFLLLPILINYLHIDKHFITYKKIINETVLTHLEQFYSYTITSNDVQISGWRGDVPLKLAEEWGISTLPLISSAYAIYPHLIV